LDINAVTGGKYSKTWTFNPEHDGIKFLRNFCNYLPVDTALRQEGLESKTIKL
jgi:hypothetical protein